MQTAPVILLKEFIQATRDSGYRGVSYAVAELVDNAFEANAKNVHIQIASQEFRDSVKVVVTDDGDGMSPSELMLALQFGGSTRFNARTGMGRYGMGLPNSSLSQSRRFEVYSWRNGKRAWWTYFDLDEFVAGGISGIPSPIRRQPELASPQRPDTGTSVVWKKCDRLDQATIENILVLVSKQLGRVFRRHLKAGRQIFLNGNHILPFDPLFLENGGDLAGARPYGPPLTFNVELTGSRHRSPVTVRFSELPISDWHRLSNEEKTARGISKRAGVSVLRAGREIDYGWFFMGRKRMENYDDWWRCEVEFEPELDELFGVTHTKQEIHPTKSLLEILSPDIERIAHDLNSRVRKSYSAVKNRTKHGSVLTAIRRDHLVAPPALMKGMDRSVLRNGTTNGRVGGLEYEFVSKDLEELSFFRSSVKGRRLSLILNEKHPFYEKVYRALLDRGDEICRQNWELALLALARAESSLDSENDRRQANRLRELWSNILTAFLN